MNTASAASTMMEYRAGQPPEFAASTDDPKNGSPLNLAEPGSASARHHNLHRISTLVDVGIVLLASPHQNKHLLQNDSTFRVTAIDCAVSFIYPDQFHAKHQEPHQNLFKWR
jgi:hypothetical protein